MFTLSVFQKDVNVKVKFNSNLGSIDIVHCNREFGESLNVKDCVVGAEVAISSDTHSYLTTKYPAILTVTDDEVRGESRAADIKGVTGRSAQGAAKQNDK